MHVVVPKRKKNLARKQLVCEKNAPATLFCKRLK